MTTILLDSRVLECPKNGGKGGTQLPSQSAPSILVLKNMGGSVTLKKKSGPYFGLDIFQVPDPKKISSRPDKLEKWVQIDWTNM